MATSPPSTNLSPTSFRTIFRSSQARALLLFFFALDVVRAEYLCPEEEEKAEKDHDGFFHQGLHIGWDAHHIGWATAGGAAFIATIASLTNIYLHCKNYNKPLEQRQIVRILLMPAIYSISSFFAYRYYRHYVHFAIIRDTYEAFVLASFLILCLLYVGRSPLEQQAVMREKEKTPLIFPLCFWRYRPSKPYFLVATKWSVLQYVILRPMISVAALITDTQKVFCGSSYNPHFANLWLTIIIFTSATIALYGLLIIHHLAKEDLKGHRPMMKFMSIKIAVFLVFYQGFLLSFFDHLGYFEATEYWSRYNIADGINALATTIEMAIIGVFQLFAYPYTEYRALIKGSAINRRKSPWKNFLHSQDYRDFGNDILMALRFFLDYLRGVEYTRSRYAVPKGSNGLDFQAAFGLDPEHARVRDVEWLFEEERKRNELKSEYRSSTFQAWVPESELQEQVWSSNLFEDSTKSLGSVPGESTYESIKLGNFEGPYSYQVSSPRSQVEEQYAQMERPDDHDGKGECAEPLVRKRGDLDKLVQETHHGRKESTSEWSVHSIDSDNEKRPHRD